jgi:Bifunctional DNA primase/polymerase, N-terminal
MSDAIYAEHAETLWRAGFAVLPLQGKRPIRSGFTKWTCAPSLSTIAGWAAKDPAASIGYVPGLCNAGQNGDALVVIDADDDETAAKVEDMFGPTPGMVKTRRGRHALYRGGGVKLPQLSSLKKFGLNADLKHGRSIVVAPPSRHESGMAYTWLDCDPSVIHHLPVFDADALYRIIDRARSQSIPGAKSPPNVTLTAPARAAPARDGLRDGSRGLGLNDRLCAAAWEVDTQEDLLDVARTINASFAVPLDEREVVRRANAVWLDLEQGKLQRFIGRPGSARTGLHELKHLTCWKNGGDALALLMLLRIHHAARVARGETFAITSKAMADKQVLHWSRDRFRKATKALLAAGYIKVVRRGRNGPAGRTSTAYSFATPSQFSQ